MQTIPVIFRAERDSGEVIAVFPTLDEGDGCMTAYAHVGQHSACHWRWYHTTRPATPAEYADLLAELTAIYATRPASQPDIYGEPARLVIRKRISRK